MASGTRPTVRGVVAIVRLRAHEPPDELVAALVAGGVTTVEVTAPTPGALAAVGRWTREPGVTVGVGTVRSAAQARAALDAGAAFLVTPTTAEDVLREIRVPVLAGATTPTEIERAWRLGAAAVKVFPVGALGGPAYVRAVREPLDDVPLVPTGGVRVEDVAAYRRAGCTGVGVGSALVSDDVVAGGDWGGLAARARQLADAWGDPGD
ncbi:MAG: bifunctional 4-hydroxy-2-oxoglutarate aldolase/2-dehydro-3-deoxy-phosphogluconate aldolase [Actinomycetes bacterium]